MPGFRKTLKRWIRDSYDYLGLVLVYSFIWFGVFLAGMGLIAGVGKAAHPGAVIGMSLAFMVFVLSPLAAGVYAAAKKMVTRDDPAIVDVFHGFREYFADAWRLGFWQLFITLMLVANAVFYLLRPGIGWKVLGVLVVYAFILWAMSMLYHYPVLIEQKPGVLKILKRGFLLTLDNVAFTLGVFFVIILLTCFTAVTLLGLPLLYLGMASILQTRLLRGVFVKYDMLPPEREFGFDDVDDPGFKLPDPVRPAVLEVEGDKTDG